MFSHTQTERFIYYEEHSNIQEQKGNGKKQPQKNITQKTVPKKI